MPNPTAPIRVTTLEEIGRSGMTMVERVKAAIRDEIAFERDEDEDKWMVEGGVRGDRFFDDTARAVLAAMREPTEAMESAYFDVLDNKPMAPDTVWGAMIDAALAEEGKI